MHIGLRSHSVADGFGELFDRASLVAAVLLEKSHRGIRREVGRADDVQRRRREFEVAVALFEERPGVNVVELQLLASLRSTAAASPNASR